ncbi:hypothetical protein F9277_05110 [Vibrio harveyi]|nr:hypothetical protein F9277_05110 [Vibrio harveyi]
MTEHQSQVYEPSDDKAHIRHKEDTRKPRLTLKHLNKLRKYKNFKKAEMEKKLKVVSIVYKTPPPADAEE